MLPGLTAGSSVGVSQKTKIILWAKAAGRCAFLGCRRELVMQAVAPDEESLVGDICHIVSESRKGPRGQSAMNTEERDSPANLILFCKVHHKLVDDQWRTYTVELLLQMKEQHERWVRESLLEFGLEDAEAVSGRQGFDVPPERLLYREVNEPAPEGTIGRPEWAAFNRGDFRGAILEIESWTRQHPDDAAAWEALAWAEYNCCRYAEALRSIGTALATGRASDEAPYIRACILAEDGIERADRASLLEANTLFRRRATERGEWVDHYNYANTLTALGRHEEAKQSYLASIEKEDGHPQAWKNLASTYHLLGDHAKEMECFERVLTIDSDHPQCLASKGVSLLVDVKDAPGAVALLERALEVAPDLAIRWSTVWYWLASAQNAAGEPLAALRTVTRGLDLAPSNPSLRDLKARLLADQWRKDPAYREEAAAFFEFMVQLAPYAYDHRSELVELFAAAGREDRAWQLLDDAYALFEFGAAPSLKETPFSLNEVRTSLHYLPDYAAFRSRSPVQLYWDVEDPLYATGEYSGAPPPLSSNEERKFVQSFAVAFGLGCDVLSDSPGDAGDSLPKMVEAIARALAFATVTASSDLLVSLVSSGDKGSRLLSLAELPDFIGLVLFRELCRQTAHIRSLFQVADAESLLSLHSGELLATFQVIAVTSLEQICAAITNGLSTTAEDV